MLVSLGLPAASLVAAISSIWECWSSGLTAMGMLLALRKLGAKKKQKLQVCEYPPQYILSAFSCITCWALCLHDCTCAGTLHVTLDPLLLDAVLHKHDWISQRIDDSEFS